MRRFLVIFEKTGTGFSAWIPDLPGCVSTGQTREECERNIYEAALFHIEGLKEDGLSIPESVTDSEVMLLNGVA